MVSDLSVLIKITYTISALVILIASWTVFLGDCAYAKLSVTSSDVLDN